MRNITLLLFCVALLVVVLSLVNHKPFANSLHYSKGEHSSVQIKDVVWGVEVPVNNVMDFISDYSIEQVESNDFTEGQVQAESVLKKFPNSQIISPNDNNLLDIPIICKNGQNLIFRVLLQSTFPQQPPLITLLCLAKHVNLDNNGYVVHSQLRQWNSNSNLGEVLFLVFKDFINIPPSIISLEELPKNHITKISTGLGMIGNNNNTTTTVSPTTMNTNNNNMGSGGVTNGVTGGSNTTSTMVIPSVPLGFTEISEITDISMIQSLLDNNELFETFIEDLNFVKGLKNIYNDLRNANLDVAKKNVEKDKNLTNLKEELNVKKVQNESLVQNVQQLQQRQVQLSQRYAPNQLLYLLNEKIDEIDHESEVLGEQFLDQLQSVNSQQTKEFTDNYLEKRSLYYLRKQKRDRFKETYCK
ncbi:hypothetical protein ABK040_016576 [Willaertia magna]